MARSQTHRRLGSAAAVVLCLLGTETYAQVPSEEGPGAEPSGPVRPRHERQLDEVTVRANRRDESNQRVPGAVSVVPGQALAKFGPADLQSVAALVPGLLFNRQANASIPFLRGVGTPVGEAGDEPSVALYIDEVYIPAGSASLANLTSIDHIEVDKGPQGTLFGRNATGGVVQVITKNPTDTREWQFSAGYGNYDTSSADLYANGAIASQLLANVSLYWSNQSEGWGRNITTETPAFRSRDYGGRAKLLWQGQERTSALLSFDYDLTVTQQGLGFRAFPGTGSLNPLPPFPNGGIPPAPDYYDPNENFNSNGSDRQFGVSLKVSEDFENSHLVSVSAYRDTRADYLLDEDSGPLPLVNVQIATPETTFTQELRFVSRSNAHIDWIGGAFYFNDKAGFDPTHFTGAAFAPLPFANSYGTQITQSYAVFAQARGSIGENTHLTLGGRYTRDERTERAAATFGAGPIVPAPNSPQSMTWSSPTWRVVLDRQLTPNVLGIPGFQSRLQERAVQSGGVTRGFYRSARRPRDVGRLYDWPEVGIGTAQGPTERRGLLLRLQKYPSRADRVGSEPYHQCREGHDPGCGRGHEYSAARALGTHRIHRSDAGSLRLVS